MRETLLGIDIGTSSSKGCLVDTTGTVVASAERQHSTSTPRPGWFEHDAETVWWHDVVELCRELTGHAPGTRAPAPAAVCLSGIGPCLLPTDERDHPLRPAILYGVDTRATAEIEELTTRFSPKRLLARGGSPLTSQAIGPKLRWLQRHEPDVWDRCRRFYMAHTFAVRRLTGTYVLDHPSASQCDPLYDMAARAWAEDWAGQLFPDLELPRLAWPSEIAGRVTQNAAAETGLRRGTPVLAGTIDAWAEGLSVGVRDVGDLMLMYGTTMFLVRVVERPRPDRRLWTTAGALPDTWTLAGGMATSGALTAWLRDIVGGTPYAQLMEEAAAIPPGSDGLVALPYFAGERTPLFDPDARGVFAGLHLGHGRAHLYRALLEATAYGVRHNLEAMSEVAGPAARVVAVGGGTRGDLWTQIVSDVTGQPQELHRYSDGASYGDARLAAMAVHRDERCWNPVVAVAEPAEANRPLYDELYAIYGDLYDRTASLQHRLARLQRDTARLT